LVVELRAGLQELPDLLLQFLYQPVHRELVTGVEDVTEFVEEERQIQQPVLRRGRHEVNCGPVLKRPRREIAIAQGRGNLSGLGVAPV
jgi:hypothetical protein